MRREPPRALEAARLTTGRLGSHAGYGMTGAFDIAGPCGERLKIIASDASEDVAAGWEHVSVSTKRRCPNWTEMCFVKDLFFDEEETVIQFHPPRSEYVNNMRMCLHLWRDTRAGVRLPPAILVGVKALGTLV